VTDTTRCGVFTRRENQAFRSTAGVCSFMDPTAEVGRPQAPQGYAFKCSPTTEPLSAFYSFVSLVRIYCGVLFGVDEVLGNS